MKRKVYLKSNKCWILNDGRAQRLNGPWRGFGWSFEDWNHRLDGTYNRRGDWAVSAKIVGWRRWECRARIIHAKRALQFIQNFNVFDHFERYGDLQ